LTDNGERVDKNTVACLMKKADIQSKVHKRFVVTTDSRKTKEPAENILAGAFTGILGTVYLIIEGEKPLFKDWSWPE